MRGNPASRRRLRLAPILLTIALAAGVGASSVSADPVESGTDPATPGATPETPPAPESAPAPEPAVPPATAEPPASVAPPAEEPLPAPSLPAPVDSGPAAPSEPSAPPAAEPLPPAPLSQPTLAAPIRPAEARRSSAAAHHDADSPRAAASKENFDKECGSVSDPAACRKELSDLSDRVSAACPDRRPHATPECLKAATEFGTRKVCVGESDPDACAARLAQNPCSTDPASDACLDFITPFAANRVPGCPPKSGPASFQCEVLEYAFRVKCTVVGGCGGGGSEESNSPTSRANPVPPDNQFASAGLVDPGARGDAGLEDVSAAPSGGKADEHAPKSLPQTGARVWAFALAGLIVLAAGALLRLMPRRLRR